jgi:signal transduction histidine kinase
MRGIRTLRTRLFLWFFGAIVVAFASSAAVVGCTRPEAFTTGAEVLARNVSTRLALDWDDAKATDDFVEEVRRVTGFEVRLFRDPGKLPPNVKRVALRGGLFAPNGPERVFVPILRGGELVGALQMERYGGGFRPAPLWRLGLGLLAAMLVVIVAASRVANELARPLERLGEAADRFGAGDLAFRTDLADAPKRWIASEVHGVAVAFNEMAARVEATVRGQRELLGAISHELRSPLGRARVALEIARDRVNDEAAPESRRSPVAQLGEIERQLAEVDVILGDLLAVTRAGLADLRREPTAIVPWIRARADEERAAGAIEIDATSIDDSASVDADRALLARAFHNVVANAHAHGHPEDAPLRVVVGPGEAPGTVVIGVRDRGPGFAPDFLPRAFEPFVRGDAARARVGGGGTGLGLALVRRIAEAHGGSATAANLVEGETIVGAEVCITLKLGRA